jgi:DNA-binding transcriptional regulator LsrR (DeoR family)
MITVDTIGKVRRAYFVQKRTIKAIARDLRLARNTVRDIVRAGVCRGRLACDPVRAQTQALARRFRQQ